MPKIWMDGALVDQEDAKVSVFDHGLLYGDGVFEGIRAYGGRVFKLGSHLRRLEESGLIRAYRALLEARTLGLNLMAFIQISMDRHTPERFANFEGHVAACPEILECHLITGQDADYLLKVIVADMDAFQSLLLERITRIDGVTGVHSSFVMKSPVNKTALPIL